jgi:tRNA pseudouridine55 synthase
MGRRLGCRGHVVALRRLVVGPFDEARALSLETLIAAREAGDVRGLDRFLAPLALALSGLPELAVNASDAARLGRGQSVLVRGRDAPLATPAAYATHAGAAIALGEIAEGAFHPRRVFKA